MKTRRLWIALVVVLMAAVAAGIGMGAREDFAALNDAGAAIREQTAILEEVRVEKQIFEDKLDDMAKSFKESADSTSGSRGKALLDMSFLAGKEQTILDQKQMRAEKRLAFQIERRDAAKESLTKRGAGLAAAELLLLAAVFIVARRFGRGATA